MTTIALRYPYIISIARACRQAACERAWLAGWAYNPIGDLPIRAQHHMYTSIIHLKRIAFGPLDTPLDSCRVGVMDGVPQPRAKFFGFPLKAIPQGRPRRA